MSRGERKRNARLSRVHDLVVDRRDVGIDVAKPQQIVAVCAARLKATLDLRSTLASVTELTGHGNVIAKRLLAFLGPNL